MIGRVATKITNFFLDEEQGEKRSHQKRPVNSISPNTPVKPNLATNSIDHKTLIGTCHSLKKMKIDIDEEQNQEINHERGSLIDIETDDGHQSQENELYHASIVSLSSSSSLNESPDHNNETILDDKSFEVNNMNLIQQYSASLTDDIFSSIATPMFVSIGTQTISKSTIDAFTQTVIMESNILKTFYTSTSAINMEDVVTDEDIMKYLTKKRQKQQ